MGWTFLDGTSRDDIIHELTKCQSSESKVFRTLKHTLEDNVLYALHESGEVGSTKKWICVYLLECDRGWGYKDMPETMHPYYYDCPVSYLDEADEASSEQAGKWRAKVRELAA